MTSDYSPREILEREHQAQELLERGERKLMRFVPLLAAVLAVLAGLSSLYGGRLSERILTLKNEAVLHEVSASDLWSEYQAESVKAHLYTLGAETQSGPRGAKLRSEAAKYRAEQVPLRASAQHEESERDLALGYATSLEKRKASFDAAVALYEIAIVLTSVAALTRQPSLLALAVVLGATALFFDLRPIFWAS